MVKSMDMDARFIGTLRTIRATLIKANIMAKESLCGRMVIGMKAPGKNTICMAWVFGNP